MTYFIIAFLFFVSCQEEIPLRMEFEYNKFEQVIPNEDFLFIGNLKVYNDSNDKIKLPKSFDLEIIVKDSEGRIMCWKEDHIPEYQNLIISKRPFIIQPKTSLEIGFHEWRLPYYGLRRGEKYYVQYVFHCDEFCNRRLRKNNITQIQTNIAEILYE